MKQCLRFAAAGIVGFLTDFGVLYCLVNGAGMAPLPARVLSFIVAATVTWKAHRHFTFSSNMQQQAAPAARRLAFLAATSIGGCIVIGIFHLCMILLDSRGSGNLLLAVAAGSAAALAFNYFLASRWIFSRQDA